MLKLGLLIFVILCFIVLTGLFYLSLKTLRQTQKQEALEKNNQKIEYELHPKLKEEHNKTLS